MGFWFVTPCSLFCGYPLLGRTWEVSCSYNRVGEGWQFLGPLERAFCFHLQSQAFQEMWTDILSCTVKLFTSKHGVTSRKVRIITVPSSVGQRSRCRRCVDGKCLYQRTTLRDITNQNNNLNIDLRCNPNSYIIRGPYRKSWATIFCKVTRFIIDKPNTPP